MLIPLLVVQKMGSGPPKKPYSTARSSSINEPGKQSSQTTLNPDTSPMEPNIDHLRARDA